MRALGILALIIGTFLFFINYTMAADAGFYFRKFFRLSVFLICIGITFTIFAGKPLTAEQKKDKENEYKYFWKNAPLLHKIAWVIGIAGGFILSVSLV